MKPNLVCKLWRRLPCAAAAACLLAATTARAVDVSWTGLAADNQWTNPANWSSDPNLPVEGTGTSGDVLLIDTVSNHAIYDAADGTRNYRQVRVGYNADGRLDVTGGVLNGDNTIQQRIGRGGHAGTVNISGAGRLKSGHIAEVGLDNNSVGVVNISDSGVYEVFRGATKDGQTDVSIALGAGGTGQGTLTIADDGRVYTRFGVLVGQNSGLGSGRYHVDGGTSLSLIGGNNGANAGNSGFWRQSANGTLQATVDAAGQLGSIQIYESGALNSFVTFESGAMLDLGFSGTPTAGSWDLMTFRDGGLTDNGLTLDAADALAGWSFAFVDAGGDAGADTLRITYIVPEPATLVLCGIGAAAAAIRRRRG